MNGLVWDEQKLMQLSTLMPEVSVYAALVNVRTPPALSLTGS
jgi:hypothetical protein